MFPSHDRRGNGQKRSEYNYKLGKKDGVQLTWHENGQKSSEYNYNLGKKDGVQLTWHDNGKKSEEWHYKNGLCSREPEAWDSDGDSALVSVYVSGDGPHQIEERDGLYYLTGTDFLFSGIFSGYSDSDGLFHGVYENGKLVWEL